MKVQGTYEFGQPRDDVWDALMDPNVLSKTMPGFERLEEIGENEYEGALDIRVGPVQGKFIGNVKLSDLDQPSSYHLALNGQGSPGYVKGEGTMDLKENEKGTELTYDFDLNIGGRIASVGQRMLDSASRSMTKQALRNLEKQLELRAAGQEAPETQPKHRGEVSPKEEASARASAEETQAPRTPPPPPEFQPEPQLAVAIRTTADVLADLVPEQARPYAIMSAVLAFLLFVSLTC